jgi:hypothetical protein
MARTPTRRTALWLLSALAVLAPSFGCGGGGDGGDGGDANLPVTATFDLGALFPHSFTGLAYDGTFLWFEDDVGGQVYPVNPDTGAVGAPIALGPSPHVHAVQADAFWTHCGCGGSREAQLRTKTDTLLDEISTETELGFPLGLRVRGIAFDSVAGIVWLHGQDRETDVRQFVGVDASGEPDVTVSGSTFDSSIRSMTWDGAHMWALADGAGGQVVERIDMTTFEVVQQFAAPRSDVDWQGIASVAGRLFLVGTTAATTGILIEVAP